MQIDYNFGVPIDFCFKTAPQAYAGKINFTDKEFSVVRVDYSFGEYTRHIKTDVEEDWDYGLVVMLLCVREWMDKHLGMPIFELGGLYDYYRKFNVFRYELPWWWEKDNHCGWNYEEGVEYYGVQERVNLYVEDMYGNNMCVPHDFFVPVRRMAGKWGRIIGELK